MKVKNYLRILSAVFLLPGSLLALYVPHNLPLVKVEAHSIPNALTPMAPGPSVSGEFARLILNFRGTPDLNRLVNSGFLNVQGEGARYSALVPVSFLGNLDSAFPDITSILPDILPQSLSFPNGEEVGLYNTALFTSRDFTGSDVKVAIIDGGFQYYQNVIAAGRLPSNIKLVNFSDNPIDYAGDGYHGTAVAEVVHEIAPDAELHLIKIDSQGAMIKAKNYCMDNGIKIANHSMGWFMDGWGNGDGYIYNYVVKPLYDAGVLWVNSAGNSAEMSYTFNFVDTNGNGYHDFPNGLEYGIISNANNGYEFGLYMNWDAYNAYYSGGTFTDFNLEVYDRLSPPHLFASSTEIQPGYFPVEFVESSSVASNKLYFKIRKVSGTGSEKIRIVSRSHNISPRTSDHSLMSPSDGERALCVGAVPYSLWNSGTAPESFSSRGPSMDGRIKPDVVGIDGMTNELYGRFYGTSSASPSVVGLAALMLSKESYLTVDQLFNRIRDNAIDIGAAGPDNDSGYGKVNLGLYPVRRNVDESTTNHSIIINSVLKSDRKVYYYGVHTTDKIILRSLTGEKIKEFTPIQGLFATGDNFIDLSSLHLAKGIYLLQFIGQNYETIFKKIIIND